MSGSSVLQADVVIVGYGLVGATAANFLGQAGLDVVVVERDPSPYPRARAISTDEEVLRNWQQVGLAEDLKADMLGDRPILGRPEPAKSRNLRIFVGGFGQ